MAFLVPANIPQGYIGPRSVRHTLMARLPITPPKTPKYTDARVARTGQRLNLRRRLFDAGVQATASYAANALGPYGRAAYTGYRMARAAKRYLSTGKHVAKQTSRKRVYHTKGQYVGKFKKSGKKNELAMYTAKGFVNTDEIAGTVSDPDCVYLTTASLDPYACIAYAIEALYRKLLVKAGLKVSSKGEIIPARAPEDARDWVIRLLASQEGTGADEIIVYRQETTAASSINSLVNTTTVLNAFMQYSSGVLMTTGSGSDSATVELTRLQLYFKNTATEDMFVCELDLREETIHYYGKAYVKVQNRTLATGGSADAEDVNNNPLEGRMYYFDGIPKCKVYESFPINIMGVNRGVQLVRAAQFGGAAVALKEPPLPKIFWNCKSASKIVLNPGDVKKASVKVEGQLRFLTWLKRIRLNYGTTPGFGTTYSIFKTNMIALEDMINLSASSNVSVAFEVNRVSAFYFSTKKNTSALGGYTYTAYNNNA